MPEIIAVFDSSGVGATEIITSLNYSRIALFISGREFSRIEAVALWTSDAMSCVKFAILWLTYFCLTGGIFVLMILNVLYVLAILRFKCVYAVRLSCMLSHAFSRLFHERNVSDLPKLLKHGANLLASSLHVHFALLCLLISL